ATLGARVYRAGRKEIGWLPVSLTDAGVRSGFFGAGTAPERTVFHWHGETFELPRGAELLARSPVVENQAFAWGEKAVGIQFHLEVGPAEARGMVEALGEELREPSSTVQSGAEILAR